MNRAAAGLDDTGLKAYWKFNESSGDIINQSASAVDLGSAADITITGATYSQTGKIGNALLFDGVNDYGEAGTSLSQWNFLHNTTAQWTIAFWMKAAASIPSSENGIFSINGASASFIGAEIYATTTEQLVLYIGDGSGTATIGLGSGNNYVPDTTNWYFYVFTYDYSIGSNNGKIKRNDANLVQGSTTGSHTNSDASHSMEILRNTRTNSNYLNAYLDEASIWDKVMSTDDQTSLYNSGSGLEIY